jgi:large subunit ribosomal protein L1
MRNGPVVRDTIKLPYPTTSGERFGVICPEGSEIAAQALQSGATAVGEETMFERIRNGDMPFDRLLCHEDSEEALKRANLGRLLGPKGLMPSRKLGTVTNNIRKTMTAGANEYRERVGVVRLVVGELGFTPRMVADNIAAIVKEIKSRCIALEDLTEKAVSEVVLSSSHGPGFNLNGKFNSVDPEVTEEHLSGVM